MFINRNNEPLLFFFRQCIIFQQSAAAVPFLWVNIFKGDSAQPKRYVCIYIYMYICVHTCIP